VGSEWCSPIVPVLKKNGNVRICVDFRYLNKAIIREPYQIPSFEELLSKLNGASVFSILDARSGYHQVPICPTSQKYLSFSSPNGVYEFTRMPFGIVSAPEIFQRIMCDMLTGLEGVVCYMDDVLVYGKSKDHHDRLLQAVLEKLSQSGLKLNKDKCKMGQTSVEFVGHILSADGVHPHPEKLLAISKYPEPKSFSDVRSFLGLAEYVGHRFISHFSLLAAPLWAVCNDKEFEWSDKLSGHFKTLQEALVNINPLQYFDPDVDVVIQTDASGCGLGAVLLQKGNVILYASRKLTDCECRYSQLEKEFLAIVFALYRFRGFVFGLHINIETDNKPVVSFFEKAMDKLPLRIQRWMLRLQGFRFRIRHIAGSKNVLADTFSRAPNADTVPMSEELLTGVVCRIEELPILRDDIITATNKDSLLIFLREVIRSQWTAPARETLKAFYPVRDTLSVTSDGIILMGSRIVLPSELHEGVLRQAHVGHLGRDKTNDLLKSYFFWPNMSRDIGLWISKCPACIHFSRLNSSVPLTSPVTDVKVPWDTVAIDFTGGSKRVHGKLFLSIIDYFSRYPFLAEVKTSSSEEVIRVLEDVFSMFGSPNKLISDNGTAFTSVEFKVFLDKWGISHSKSSAYYPQSNGVVERFHGTLKHRLDKLLYDGVSIHDAVCKALFDIRGTASSSTGKTPFFLFVGREMPTSWQKLLYKSVTSNKRDLPKQYAKLRGRLVSFDIGSNVLVRRGKHNKFSEPAYVVSKSGFGSWLIRFQNGTERVYNQRYIRPCAKDLGYQKCVDEAFDFDTSFYQQCPKPVINADPIEPVETEPSYSTLPCLTSPPKSTTDRYSQNSSLDNSRYSQNSSLDNSYATVPCFSSPKNSYNLRQQRSRPARYS
jgi:transposase InsO family protein